MEKGVESKKAQGKTPKSTEKDRVYFGDSKEVVSVDHQDYNDFVKVTERHQEITGFDKDYRDVVDYVLKITHRIWEEKGIGVIYDTYHNDVTMHTQDSIHSTLSPSFVSFCPSPSALQ